MDGMELLARVVQGFPEVPVIVLTAHGSVSVAVEAMRRGAADFVEKPFERDDVLEVVQTALLKARELDEPPPASTAARSLLGDSPTLRAVVDSVRRAAGSSATVLIRGENGTGKELLARAVHEMSPRASGPFVTLNCAALPETLVESEIFGHQKGAFTGATKDKPGRVELAHGGTLFLDEIGDYSPSIQLKLLRVLQEREVQRLGATDTLKVDVRFVAATNKNLEAALVRGEFREDLFYRLNVIPIDVPPLRNRPEDIPVLARYFAERSAATNSKLGITLEPAALDLLSAQEWRGNVRQLGNFVERLVVFADGAKVTSTDVERELASDRARQPPVDGAPASQEPQALATARAKAEREAVVRALSYCNDNRARAARMLNMSRRTLYNKLREFGIR
jgi:DNA-binding NtrC family response regulator